MNNLEVIILTKRSLKAAIAENTYWNGTFDPPFSIHKAKWMLENERADDDDVFAILGYENHSIVAFVYLVPDLVKGADGISKKLFWSQRWWVSDKYKDTVLSTYVKNISLKECSNQIIIRFLGDNTKAYYEKQPFTKFSIRKRFIIVFSLDYGLLVYKKNSLKKIASILKFADSFSRRIIAFINKRKSNIINKDITIENVSFINDETWSFLENHCSKDIVPKNMEYINWQLNNNQYHIVKNNTDKPEYKCLLGSISEKIYNLNTVVKLDNEIIGFISGLVSGNRFIIRYFIVADTYYNECANILVKNVIHSNCTILQTEDSKLGDYVKSKYFKVYSDVKELVSLIHNDVSINFENSIMTDQDGNFY